MKELFRMVVVLTLFGLASGFLLAWTSGVTSAPIERARKAEMLDALKRVLPESDNDPAAEARTLTEDGREWTFYVARKGGALAGVAFKSSSERGYGGAIDVLVSVNADASIRTVEVLQADKETPGLGIKVKEPSFRDQFKGRPAADTGWAKVTKDGGEIQGVTGATISSRAVTEAVKLGLDVYMKHAGELAGSEK